VPTFSNKAHALFDNPDDLILSYRLVAIFANGAPSKTKIEPDCLADADGDGTVPLATLISVFAP